MKGIDMPKKKGTSDAQKKAMKKYDSKYDTISIRFEHGTVEFLREHGVESINAYVKKLVETDMLKQKEDSTVLEKTSQK
jgi:hypothetical protein